MPALERVWESSRTNPAIRERLVEIAFRAKV
jgi:hypothetical protein